MDSRFYVSLEAARLLKKKGYDKERDFLAPVYTKDGVLYWSNHEDLSQMTPATTLLEAMDWLEKRGVHIEIRMMHCKVKGDPYKIADDDEYQWKWYFAICKGDDVEHPIVEEGEDGYVVMHSDKNECMNAAVKKGVELL